MYNLKVCFFFALKDMLMWWSFLNVTWEEIYFRLLRDQTPHPKDVGGTNAWMNVATGQPILKANLY